MCVNQLPTNTGELVPEQPQVIKQPYRCVLKFEYVFVYPVEYLDYVFDGVNIEAISDDDAIQQLSILAPSTTKEDWVIEYRGY